MTAIVSPSLRELPPLFRRPNRLLMIGGKTFRRKSATKIKTVNGCLALGLPGDMLCGLSLRWPTDTPSHGRLYQRDLLVLMSVTARHQRVSNCLGRP
jgi:hypothetical protein